MENRADWVLLALHFAGQKGLTPAQLQKSLFVLQQNFPKAQNLTYDFRAYNYGPFDAGVYQDAESLMELGLVNIRQRNGVNWGSYHITQSGDESIAAIKLAKDKAQNYLSKIVIWAQSLSFSDLITSIYKQYPEFKVNSIFRGQ